MSDALSPIDAVRRFDKDPDSIGFPMRDFVKMFDMSEHEFVSEARSGRLQACGTPTPRGFCNIFITAADMLHWLANPKTPQFYRDRWDAGYGQRARQ